MSLANPLLSRFSEEILTFWNHLNSGIVHTVQRDPKGDVNHKVGIFPVSTSQELSPAQCQTLKGLLLTPELWILNARTRHLPNPQYLLELSTEEVSRKFFVGTGHQIWILWPQRSCICRY